MALLSFLLLFSQSLSEGTSEGITIILRLSPEFCRTSLSNFKFELPFQNVRKVDSSKHRNRRHSKQLLLERLCTNSLVWLFSNCVLILSFSFLSIFSFSLLAFPFALCLDTAVVSFTELSSSPISGFLIL